MDIRLVLMEMEMAVDLVVLAAMAQVLQMMVSKSTPPATSTRVYRATAYKV